jgi:hypothetical protein
LLDALHRLDLPAAQALYEREVRAGALRSCLPAAVRELLLQESSGRRRLG